MEVLRIQRGHCLFSSIRADNNEYIFQINVTEKEHKPGYVDDDEMKDDNVMPLFSMVINSPDMARLMALLLSNLANKMDNDAMEDENENNLKPTNEMTVKEYMEKMENDEKN